VTGDGIGSSGAEGCNLNTACVIRPATVFDAAPIQAIYAPIVRDTHTSFELVPPSAEEMAGRMAAHPVLPWLVCDHVTEGVLGYAYARRFRERPAYQWTVETSVYVRPDAARRGVARALYAALFDMLLLMSYRTVVAGITLPNPASVALHERVGFSPVGVFRHVGYKLGAWYDVAWYQLDLAPSMATPAPPAFLKTVEGTPAYREALKAAVMHLKVRG
jgi:phosphinothricin acetyltransferase